MSELEEPINSEQMIRRAVNESEKVELKHQERINLGKFMVRRFGNANFSQRYIVEWAMAYDSDSYGSLEAKADDKSRQILKDMEMIE